MERRNKHFNILLLFIFQISLCATVMAQTSDPPPLSSQVRVNFLNPGLDVEAVITKSTVLSFGGGVGYFGKLEELSGPAGNNGFQYLIAPFFDTQYKFI